MSEYNLRIGIIEFKTTNLFSIKKYYLNLEN